MSALAGQILSVRVVRRVHRRARGLNLARARLRDRRRVRGLGRRQDDVAAADRGTVDAPIPVESASRETAVRFAANGSTSRCGDGGSG